jgi:hypothetical protein
VVNDIAIGVNKGSTNMATLDLKNITYTLGSDLVTQTFIGNLDDLVVTAIVNSELVETLAGNDSITGNAIATNFDGSFNTNAIGIFNDGTISTSNGSDLIVGRADGFSANGIYNQGVINTGSGNDQIIGQATSKFERGNLSWGIHNNSGEIDLGEGNDLIIGTSTDNVSGGSALGILNYFGSKITAGAGNDEINGTANTSGTDSYMDAQGIQNTDLGDSIAAGDGNDLITGNATANSTSTEIDTQSAATGILNFGKIDAGNGNDKIVGTGTSTFIATNAYVIAMGINNVGTIDAGNGNDVITGTASATGNISDLPNYPYFKEIYGINNFGKIDAGGGNDELFSGTNINGISQKITLDGGGQIFMGQGNDLFQGFGNMNVFGDAGTGNTGKDDILDLGSLTLTDFQSLGSISKTGAGANFAQFTYNGSVMTTTEFDKFIFAGTTYSYAQLAV